MPIVLQINGKGITIRITMISDYFNLSYVQVNVKAGEIGSIYYAYISNIISTMLSWLLLYFFHGTRDTN